jgi:3-methylfumaryl-CoA hydratase
MAPTTPPSTLQPWLGRKRVEHDTASPTQAMAMAALLDLDPAAFHAGAALPEFWHWIYFRAAVPRSQLGVDGHERRGNFMPPVDLPRRMWAGGRLRFVKPIILGEDITRSSEIIAIDRKQGRSGTIVLVTVRHVINGGTGKCVEEEQDVVYVETPKPGQSTRQSPPLPPDTDWQERFLPDAVTLFRYSALMFNAHRIHYDYPFTTEVEGYRGILVHGPLTALLLLEAAKRHLRRAPLSYRYRGLAPLFNDEPITLAGKNKNGGRETEIWAAGPDGRIAMEAEASW